MSVAGNVTSRNYMAKVAKRGFQGCDQIFQGDQIKQTYLLSRWDGKWLEFFSLLNTNTLYVETLKAVDPMMRKMSFI